MNAHSVEGSVSSGKALAQLREQLLVVRCAHAAVDDLEDIIPRQPRADRIGGEVEMRRGDAELEQYGAVGLRDLEQRALGAVVDGGEVDVVVEGEVGGVLDVLPPDDHGVPAHGPVVVHDDPDAEVLVDDLAGFARVGAENAGHAITIIARPCAHSASAARTPPSPPSPSARGATAARTQMKGCRSAGRGTTTAWRKRH